MANISEAIVSFECKQTLKQMRAYIDAINDMENTYSLLEKGTITQTDYSNEKEPNTGTIDGSGSGRWAYTANLDGYFGKLDELPEWTKLGAKMPWDTDESYIERKKLTGKIQRAWLDLVKALKAGGEVIINYTDLEQCCEYFVEADATLDENGYSGVNEHSIEITPENLVDYDYADTIEDAKEYYFDEEE